MGVLHAAFAAAYDLALLPAERTTLRALRRRLLADVRGRVLELGAGTGANLRSLGPGVRELVVVEPSAAMRARLRRKASALGVEVELVDARSERLPLPDASFDDAVSTLHLCTVADLGLALSEIARVLRPGGRLLFLEHVRADEPSLARWQDRLRAPWSLIGQGCQCNRAIVPALEQAGFLVEALAREALRWAPAIVRPLAVGVARAPTRAAVTAPSSPTS